jgi:hypothetical protein
MNQTVETDTMSSKPELEKMGMDLHPVLDLSAGSEKRGESEVVGYNGVLQHVRVEKKDGVSR